MKRVEQELFARIALSSTVIYADDAKEARRVALLRAGAPVSGMDFSNCNLDQADLCYGRLTGINLTGARLRRANLQGANISDAILRDVDLTDAVLDEFNGYPRDVRGCRIRYGDPWRGHWSRTKLTEWYHAGAVIVDLDELPVGWRSFIEGDRSGLTICLSTREGHLDRILVESTVWTVLGHDSDCRLAEYREQGDTAIIRLEGSRREDLEAVAEALYHRVWELQERAQRATLAQFARVLTSQQTINVNAPVGTQVIVQNATFGLHADLAPVVTRLQKLQDALSTNLSDLVDRLERMELRLPDEDAAAKLNDQAATRKALKLVRTWTPSDNPRTALDRLLASFDPDEVQLLAAQGPDGANVVANLPAGPATPAHVGAEMVAELLRSSLVDEAFFARLEAAHSERAEEVRRVAGMWREREDEA